MIRLSNASGATLTLPITIGWRRVPFSIGVPTVPNAHGDGSVIVGRSRLEPRQFTLSGSIFYPNKQQIRNTADNLLQFLQHPPIEVYQWSDSERRLYAYPQGLPQDWMDLGAELGVDIPMLAPDPLWYGAEVTHEEPNADAWQIGVDGTAPTLPQVTITITATGSDLRLSNGVTGKAVELDGTFAAGDVVVVDAATFSATLNDEPINDRLSDEYIASGFALQPGVNGLEYDGPTANVTMNYQPRWY